jgi:hypothetical protein
MNDALLIGALVLAAVLATAGIAKLYEGLPVRRRRPAMVEYARPAG